MFLCGATKEFIENSEIKKWESVLSTRTGRSVKLELQQLQMARRESTKPKSIENHDYLSGGFIRPNAVASQVSPAEEIDELQQKIEHSLHALLSPVGVNLLRVRAVGRQPDGTLHVNLTGLEAAPTDGTLWKVAAAGIANELKSPVGLSGSMVVANATKTVDYPPKAVEPGRKKLRDAERFINQWKGRPALRYTFLALSPLDRTSLERLAFLRTKFPESVLEPDAGGLVNIPKLESSIRIQFIQLVDATSGMGSAGKDSAAYKGVATLEEHIKTE